jgi:hypothetical protein
MNIQFFLPHIHYWIWGNAESESGAEFNSKIKILDSYLGKYYFHQSNFQFKIEVLTHNLFDHENFLNLWVIADKLYKKMILSENAQVKKISNSNVMPAGGCYKFIFFGCMGDC